jgi:chaperone BCS1
MIKSSVHQLDIDINQSNYEAILYYASTLIIPGDNPISISYGGEPSYKDTKKHESLENRIHLYQIGYGTHTIKWNDLTLNIERMKSQDIIHNSKYFENIKIIFKEGQEMIDQFLNDAVDYYRFNILREKKSTEEMTSCYLFAETYWSLLNKYPKRSLDTVYLDQADKILQDMLHFLSEENKQKYRSLGVPYKKNYLFEGFPGTGKTSLCFALASALNKNIAILNFNKDIDDNIFMWAIRRLPDDVILVLEDIDVLFCERRANDNNRSMVTLSAILNTLDGPAHRDGMISIMTTNFVDRLDTALIRPGRVDKIMHFDYATKNQITKMFLRFRPDKEHELPKFLEYIRSVKITTAVLQDYLFQTINEPNVMTSIKDLIAMSASHCKYDDKPNIYS